MTVGTPTVDANGVKSYPVTSVYQGSQPQTIRVLQPTTPPAGVPPRVLYVLPVDAGVDTPSSPWGDALDQLRQQNVPNTYNMTLVEPSFNYEPWYGDNVLDPNYRMESFVIDDLVPFGDTFLPSGSTPQRYLLGFSKAGNAVLFFMLRHPGVFNAGAAWDTPAETSALTTFSALPENFGTQANYTTYNIPVLVTSNAQPFQTQLRFWISGDQADWTAEMDQLEQQMTTAGIQNTWVTGHTRAHSWTSGWLPGAVSGLATMAASATEDNGNIAPALTGGLPAGILAQGTTKATLSVNTDENATCRYATTAGVAYAAMTNTFSTTGGTAHSTSVTGLQNGQSYSYYVRCQDSSSDVDASDYVINFGVDTTAIVLTNSGNVTANAGATTGNTSTITITPSGSFTGAVNLSCSATNEFTSPTDPAACDLSSTSVTINGTSAVTDTLKIITESDTTLGVYAITVTGTDVATGKITSSTGLIATINAAPPPPPSIALSNSGNVTVTAGATSGDTSTITVTPSGGFTGAVNLTCAVTSSGSPATPATCSLASKSVSISGTSAATDTATVVTTASTTPGTYTVTVNGADAATGSITGSTSLTATINAVAPTPSIALTNSGNITVNPGATSGNTSTITVTPSGGFTGAVNLSCKVTTSVANPIDPPTCSLSPNSVTISGTTGPTSTLTVNTTGSSAALDLPLKRFFAPVGGAALAMVLFFGIPARRRAWRTLFSLVAVIAVVAGIGCSGGAASGGGGGGGGGGSTGTTAGAYTVTVTGTDAATGTITATSAVTLTVN